MFVILEIQIYFHIIIYKNSMLGETHPPMIDQLVKFRAQYDARFKITGRPIFLNKQLLSKGHDHI